MTIRAPRAPTVASFPRPKVDETFIAMAAAEQHGLGRLFEPDELQSNDEIAREIKREAMDNARDENEKPLPRRKEVDDDEDSTILRGT